MNTEFIADNVVNFFFDESFRKNIGGCRTEDGLRDYLKLLIQAELDTAIRMEASARNV